VLFKQFWLEFHVLESLKTPLMIATLKNEIDYPKRVETFSTIKPKYLKKIINIVRKEQKIACHKRSDQLLLKCC
jgi:hypothetical protein